MERERSLITQDWELFSDIAHRVLTDKAPLQEF